MIYVLIAFLVGLFLPAPYSTVVKTNLKKLWKGISDVFR